MTTARIRRLRPARRPPVLPPLTIVSMAGDSDNWGVVLGHDRFPHRYRVRRVSVTDDGYGDKRYAADGDVLLRREDIFPVGFCENDSHPQWILAAAGGYGAHWPGGYTPYS